MSKRQAGKQLTDRNWEEEDEPEEAGVFTVAAEDVLKTRQIKSAKRRGAPATEAASGAFKGFAGFGAKPATESAAPTFNFGTKPLPGLGTVSNGDKPSSGFSFTAKPSDSTESSKPASTAFTFGSPPAEASPPKSTAFAAKPEVTFGQTETSKPSAGFSFSTKSTSAASSGFTFGTMKTTTDSSSADNKAEKKNSSESNSKYLAQLKGLNEAVTKWIKEHVDKNPYVILTPIFTDYQKYVDELEKENPENVSKSASNSSPSKNDTSKATTDAGKVTEPTGFTFSVKKPEGASSDETVPKPLPFSFGSSSTGATAVTGFTFQSKGEEGETKPFSFATGGSAPAAQNNAEEDEEYVPPKPETVEIKEDDALYTKRCKMFYQKDGAWKERGVGNLHLKPLNDKTQLLLRADNTLGKVLLNIVLSSAIPTKRQGKNNVSLFCTPNPPLDPKAEDDKKPVSLLLRVKTAEDADELLEKLEKHKS